MSARSLLVCASLVFFFANVAQAARYQRCKDGKTLVWNSQRGVAQEATWSGLRDVKNYATGEGTLIWYRLGEVVNSYTGKMVQGKFEGLVIKEQGPTRLQAKFADGEKVGGWSEPGSIESQTPMPTVTPKQESPKAVETPPPTKQEALLPTPIPMRSLPPTPRPTATSSPTFAQTPIATPTSFPMPITTPSPMTTPVPTRTPAPTPSPTPTPVATPTPSPTPRSSATPSPTPSPLQSLMLTRPQLKSSLSSPTVQPPGPRLEEIVEGSAHDSLALASPPPSMQNVLEEAPMLESSAATTPPTTGSKSEMIAQFKKQTESVLAQMGNATNRFREVSQIASLSRLSEPVSASVESLAGQAAEIRTKLGYEVAMYECGAETATVDGLITAEEAMRDFTGKNAPVGRQKLMAFFKRFPAPTRDNQKPLWRYNRSILMSLDKARAEAENHLQRAKAFETAGKKAEALREYREIYRIYPNPITADKIKLLEAAPR